MSSTVRAPAGCPSGQSLLRTKRQLTGEASWREALFDDRGLLQQLHGVVGGLCDGGQLGSPGEHLPHHTLRTAHLAQPCRAVPAAVLARHGLPGLFSLRAVGGGLGGQLLLFGADFGVALVAAYGLGRVGGHLGVQTPLDLGTALLIGGAEQLRIDDEHFAEHGTRSQPTYEHAWEIRDEYSCRGFAAGETEWREFLAARVWSSLEGRCVLFRPGGGVADEQPGAAARHDDAGPNHAAHPAAAFSVRRSRWVARLRGLGALDRHLARAGGLR